MDISRNFLTDASSIPKMESLEHINISLNKDFDLGSLVPKIPNIKRLEAARCHLSTIPETIGKRPIFSSPDNFSFLFFSFHFISFLDSTFLFW